MSVFDAPDRPRELCPEGKHTGYLFTIVDVGSIRDTYMGEEKIKHRIYLGWEFPDLPMSDGRPFMHGNFYSVTDGQYGMYFPKTSNMNKMLRGWTGLDEKACSKPGLLGKLLKDHTPCSISIAHESGKKDPSKVYAVAESIKPFKGKDAPEPVNVPVIYQIGDSEDRYELVPEWLKKQIAGCLELNGGVPKREPKQAPDHDPHNGAEIDDDMGIPF